MHNKITGKKNTYTIRLQVKKTYTIRLQVKKTHTIRLQVKKKSYWVYNKIREGTTQCIV